MTGATNAKLDNVILKTAPMLPRTRHVLPRILLKLLGLLSPGLRHAMDAEPPPIPD